MMPLVSTPSRHEYASESYHSRLVSVSMTSSPHPLNVKPSGNAYIASSSSSSSGGPSREAQLGAFSALDETTLLTLFSYVSDATSLRNLSHTSRVMYAYVHDEDVWKKLYLSLLNDGRNPKWLGSWHASVLGVPHTRLANLQLPDNLVCSDVLYRPFQCSQINYREVFAKILRQEQMYHDDSLNGALQTLPPGRIVRIAEGSMTQSLFDTTYLDQPFILTNNDSSRWPRWDFATLTKRFGNVKFRQEAVQWTLDAYNDYLDHNHDESPLYLFDCSSTAMKSLRQEYRVPPIFGDDLFTLFNVHDSLGCRPDHAWLIMGSRRSGSTFHKDPNSTSAWNTALCGRKLWVMLPPDITPPGVGTNEDESEVTSPVGIAEWVISGFFNDCVKIPECRIGVTFPGECLHVPSGWWHTVINIDDSVALTQNFVPPPKLAHTLFFLKNKRDQVSGFRPQQVKEVLDYVLGHHLNKKLENMSKLCQYRDTFEKLSVDAALLNEDCGEILLSRLPPMPIYELFCELLKLDDQADTLEQALNRVAKMENSQKEKKKSETWEKLACTSTFTFAFDESSDDE